MTLILITLGAVFLGGVAVGVFGLVVIGIHADTRRAARLRDADTRTGAGSRQLLLTTAGRRDEGGM